VGYREDVRTTCAACSKALDAEDVALDEQGRSLCSACAAREGTAKANQTLAVERGKKMTRIGIAIAVAIAVGVIATLATIRKREADARNAQLNEIQSIAHERLSSLATRMFELSNPLALGVDKRCDEQLMKRLARDGGQELMTYNPLAYEHFSGYPKSRLAADVADASAYRAYYRTPAELKKAVADFDASNLVVVYVARDFVELQKARLRDDEPWPPVSGTLFVMGIAHGGPAHCWAQLRDDKPLPVHDDLRAALARITSVLHLAPDN
jgi:hypothetical protein